MLKVCNTSGPKQARASGVTTEYFTGGGSVAFKDRKPPHTLVEYHPILIQISQLVIQKPISFRKMM